MTFSEHHLYSKSVFQIICILWIQENHAFTEDDFNPNITKQTETHIVRISKILKVNMKIQSNNGKYNINYIFPQ